MDTEAHIGQVDAVHETDLFVPHGRDTRIEDGDTGYGVVGSGEASLDFAGHCYVLPVGMYFMVPGPTVIRGLTGYVCVRRNYRGTLSFGGPVEHRGRLKYIDGCSDTLLIAPMVRGDPCLNLLYAPGGVSQTPHTHPSVRVGLVLSGGGICRSSTTGQQPLERGFIFVLDAGELHSFHTVDQDLRIIVYHPETDFGPTHENHPMVNRTEIDGVSVAGNLDLQTKVIA
jgi:hypothetical protein